jgi:hypothetical protein
MTYELLIKVGGFFHLICALSHLFFPKTFHWEENLKELPMDKKKKIKNTMYLSNACTLLFWLILSYIPLFYSTEILSTQLGRAILTLIVSFWAVRIFILQPVFANYKTKEFWIRTIFFLFGFIVFLIPWIAIVAK